MLEEAISQALRPRSPREHARVWLLGGWTALQVRERLPPEAAAAWLAAWSGPEARAERALLDAVRVALLRLVGAGRARRASRRYTAELRSKGPRDVLVDVFRLS